MTDSPSASQTERPVPTLRELLAGYAIYNAWENQEQAQTLPQTSVEDSLRRYFELCAMATALAGDEDEVFFEQNVRHWTFLHQRLERLQSVLANGKASPGAG